MLDILVTVGVILILIALAALLLHLVDEHQRQRVATADYERFHPGDPRPGSSGEPASGQGSGQARTQQERRGESDPGPGT